jgi:hypothetical protein
MRLVGLSLVAVTFMTGPALANARCNPSVLVGVKAHTAHWAHLVRGKPGKLGACRGFTRKGRPYVHAWITINNVPDGADGFGGFDGPHTTELLVVAFRQAGRVWVRIVLWECHYTPYPRWKSLIS